MTAVADEIVNANPCRIRSAMGTKTQRKIEPLTAAELGALAAEMPSDLSAAVLLMGWCGLRSGEVKGLRRSDVAADASALTVQRAVTYRSGEYLTQTPKTRAGNRTVAIPPHIRPAIISHLAKNVGKPGTSLLFQPVDSAPDLSDWALRKPFKKAAEKIGKPNLRIHDLRHTGATLAAQAGATTAELMNRLGHTTPAMAMQYQHVTAGRDAEIARRLSEEIAKQ
ncbi:site-specific integrase [Rhodococcoides fascians]|uniref:site-specific integrase n=1 Tax=Rhodococcoides fascians TaxID=1828 RepID=UPI001E57532A|nr:site-specific integrase [Rhodococcus fascians]